MQDALARPSCTRANRASSAAQVVKHVQSEGLPASCAHDGTDFGVR